MNQAARVREHAGPAKSRIPIRAFAGPMPASTNDQGSTIMRTQPYTHKFGTVIPTDRAYLADDVAPMLFPRTDGVPGHWDVKEAPAAAMVDGKAIIVPGCKALVRDDNNKPLSIVSDGYSMLSVADSFRAFDPWVEAGIIRYDVGGEYHHGRRVWILAALNVDAIEVAPGDVTIPYLLLSNTFDKSGAIAVKATAYRSQCSNAIRAMMLDGVAALRVQHRGDAAGNTAAAVRSIDAIRVACEQQADAYRRMVATPAADIDVARYVAAIYRRPISEIIGSEPGAPITVAPARALAPIMDAWDHPMGGKLPTVDGTVYGLYQAATQALTHGGAGSKRSAESRMESLMFNGDSDKLDRAEVVADLLATVGIRKSSGITWDDVIAMPTNGLRQIVDSKRGTVAA